MIPLRDRNPTRRTSFVTFGLIAACFTAFAIELSVTATGGDAALGAFFERWGAVPADITAALQAGDYLGLATLGIFTSMFLHGGWLHLLGNMLFLWIFGNNVEDRLGRVAFLLFYLVGGVAAALTQVVIDPTSRIPMVGASGAIAAALGAYIVLFPGARILSLVFLGFFYQLLEVPALIVLGFWFGLQLLSGFAGLGAETADGGVAFFAHIGGFVFGLAAGLLLRVVGAGAQRRRAGFGRWDNRAMSRLVEMLIESVRVHMLSNRHVVILKDPEGDRYLPIWIGAWEASAIAMRLQGLAAERPLTHDLFAAALERLGVRVERVVISELTDETYHARIHLERDGFQVEVDARPSDALALAVRTEVQIFAAEEVLAQAALAADPDEAEEDDEDEAGVAGAERPRRRRAPIESVGDAPADPRLDMFRDFVNSLDADPGGGSGSGGRRSS